MHRRIPAHPPAGGRTVLRRAAEASKRQSLLLIKMIRSEPPPQPRMKSFLYRPTQIVIAVFVVLLLLVLGVMGWLNLRNSQRMETIGQHVSQTRDIEEVALEMQRVLLADVSGISPVDRADLLFISQEVAGLIRPSAELAGGSVRKLKQVWGCCSTPTRNPGTP